MVPSFIRQWFGTGAQAVEKPNQTKANSSDAETQFQAGLSFANGKGETQDYVQAAQRYTQAAEQNHSLAQFNLAVMYEQGRGVVRDGVKSLTWMTRAAVLGDAGAQYKLGVQHHLACRNGPVEGTPERRMEALKWLRLSAAQGYRDAESACEFVALAMTRDEVFEGERRATAFVAGKGA